MKNKKRIIIWSIIIIILAATTGAVYYFTIIPEQTKNKCNEVHCDDDHEERCMRKLDGSDCHCRCFPKNSF